MVDQTKTEGSLELLPLPAIQQRILVVRERHVMLDEDLAGLYEVQTGRLIEQVKRNIDRFPSDFMFQLTRDEAAVLRSQSAISSGDHGGRRYAPYVFTEQGVAMLSGVLRSKTAVAVNIRIMRAFVELHRAAASYTAIERRLEDLERETKATLDQHDQQLDQIFEALLFEASLPANAVPIAKTSISTVPSATRSSSSRPESPRMSPTSVISAITPTASRRSASPDPDATYPTTNCAMIRT